MSKRFVAALLTSLGARWISMYSSASSPHASGIHWFAWAHVLFALWVASCVIVAWIPRSQRMGAELAIGTATVAVSAINFALAAALFPGPKTPTSFAGVSYVVMLVAIPFAILQVVVRLIRYLRERSTHDTAVE